MLNGGGDEMAAFFTKRSDCAEDRQVVAFRAAGGEDHFAWSAAPNESYAFSRSVQHGTGPTAYMMNTGRVPINLTEKRAASPPAPKDREESWRCNRNKSSARGQYRRAGAAKQRLVIRFAACKGD